MKTLTAIAEHFWWPRMTRTIRAYVESCATCQRIKHSQLAKPGLLYPHAVPTRPWSHISMDRITDLPRSFGPDGLEYDSIMVFADLLTKQAFFARCCKDLTAVGLANLFLEHVYRYKGIPKFIVSDRDTLITSEFWQTLQARLGVTLNISTAHHPQTDGQTENINGTLEQILRAFVDPYHDDWAMWLPVAEFAYNNATHSATHATPFFANYGYHPDTPATLNLPQSSVGDYATKLKEIHIFIQQQAADAKEFQAAQANKHRRHLTFQVGDLVRLTSTNINLANQPSKKLRDRFLGPFKVTGIISRVAYRLQLPPAMARVHPVFHVSRLLPWTASPDDVFPHRPNRPQHIPAASDFVYGDAYEVDRISDARIAPTGRSLQFLVHWMPPYNDPSYNSWEPLSGVQRLDAYRDFISGPRFADFKTSSGYQAFAARYPRSVPKI